MSIDFCNRYLQPKEITLKVDEPRNKASVQELNSTKMALFLPKIIKFLFCLSPKLENE